MVRLACKKKKKNWRCGLHMTAMTLSRARVIQKSKEKQISGPDRSENHGENVSDTRRRPA